MSRVFIFDLDGVIRNWDPEIVKNAERNNGLPGGALFGVSFEADLLLAAVTGKMTDDEWRAEVATRLQQQFPDANGVGAVAAWSEPIGEVIDGSVEVLRKARQHGTVCLLSNATSRLDSDLIALGIAEEFDHIFNSSAIGFAKPDERIFAHVEQALSVDPAQIVYIDDGAANIEVAANRGWVSLLATPETRLAELLEEDLRDQGGESWRR